MSVSLPVIFANLPTGEQPLSLFDQNFAALLALIQGVYFQPLVVNSSSIVVGSAIPAIVIKRTVAGPTSVQLPSVASRNSLALVLADWNGNAGDITLTAAGGETIMGLSTATLGSFGPGVGSAASITLYPSTELGGWYV